MHLKVGSYVGFFFQWFYISLDALFKRFLEFFINVDKKTSGLLRIFFRVFLFVLFLLGAVGLNFALRPSADQQGEAEQASAIVEGETEDSPAGAGEDPAAGTEDAQVPEVDDTQTPAEDTDADADQPETDSPDTDSGEGGGR